MRKLEQRLICLESHLSENGDNDKRDSSEDVHKRGQQVGDEGEVKEGDRDEEENDRCQEAEERGMLLEEDNDSDGDDRLAEDIRSTEGSNPSWYEICTEEEEIEEVAGQKKRVADLDQDQATNVKKRACREKRILVVGDSMVRDIEDELSEFVGKEVKV